MLSYSFHISSKNHSINTSGDLKRVSNHNTRKFEEVKENNLEMNLELSQYNTLLKGSNNLYQDVKEFYKDFFEESRIEYNQKQKRDDRKIFDYFEKISDDSKKQMAVEIIVQLGDKKFWENKTIEEKLQMTEVYKEQLFFLEEKLPNFKICNAIIHFDEASPHIQLVGVPVVENCKQGMSKQVSKKAVFTKETLKELQLEMRENAIENFNKFYKTKEILKPLEKGRNKDYLIEEIKEIENLKREKENLKKEIENLKVIYSPKSDDLENFKKYEKNIQELRTLTNIEPQKVLGGLLGNYSWDEIKIKYEDIEKIKECVRNIAPEIVSTKKILQENLEQKETIGKLEKIITRQDNQINTKIVENYDLSKKITQLTKENEENRKIKDFIFEKFPKVKELWDTVAKTLYPNKEKTNIWHKNIEKDRGWER